MKGKTIAMLIGIIAALAAIAALLYHFKDQLCALADSAKKECRCGKYAEIQEDETQEEEPVEASAAEEFKDYADVELPTEEN